MVRLPIFERKNIKTLIVTSPFEELSGLLVLFSQRGRPGRRIEYNQTLWAMHPHAQKFKRWLYAVIPVGLWIGCHLCFIKNLNQILQVRFYSTWEPVPFFLTRSLCTNICYAICFSLFARAPKTRIFPRAHIVCTGGAVTKINFWNKKRK